MLGWFLFWLRNGPHTHYQSVLFWATLAAIHFMAVKAARQGFGLIYLFPVVVVWIVILIALSSGIPQP